MYPCWLSLSARLKVLSWLDPLQFHCYAWWSSLLLQEEEVTLLRYPVPRLLHCLLSFYVSLLWAPLLSKSLLNLRLRTKICCVVLTGFLTSVVRNFFLGARHCRSLGIILQSLNRHWADLLCPILCKAGFPGNQCWTLSPAETWVTSGGGESCVALLIFL